MTTSFSLLSHAFLKELGHYRSNPVQLALYHLLRSVKECYKTTDWSL